MKKLLCILCLFPFLMQAQTEVSNNRKPIVVLPDILIKNDTIIVTNNNKGSFTTIGSKTPAYYFKDMQEYQHYLTQIQCFFKYSEEEIKGYAIINFEIQEDGKIVINFSNSMNKEVNKRIAYIIVKEMKRWTPATDEKNKPIKAEGYLIAYFEVKPYVEKPTHLKIN
ncbi:hypothetical protein [Capnocytophaga sputigena]|uniref:hypothetical protein n=1 Tax=Capnocytophaga sputigena TaxID=1019 RepID=UPI00288B4866|nr:hypothetical protein [Capnocytophaga sputigena]